jgi:hypothetical protein
MATIINRDEKPNIISKDIASHLDYHKISNTAAAVLYSDLAATLDVNISSSREHIRQKRMEYRSERASEIKLSFNPLVALTVHWDGKLLYDANDDKKVDRLSISVTGYKVNKFLSCPKLLSGTGLNQANAVYNALNEWGIIDNVRGMCFDTTSSNTGSRNGACEILEQKLERQLMAFGCRHHIDELVIGAVFEVTVEIQTQGPNIKIFDRFQAAWMNLNKTEFHCPSINSLDKYFPDDTKDELVKFIREQLSIKSIRKDYQEFLGLALLFLGENNDNKGQPIRIKKPGALSRARWMAKILYSLKIDLFRNQFTTSRELIVT